jgi:hypothetical protein
LSPGTNGLRQRSQHPNGVEGGASFRSHWLEPASVSERGLQSSEFATTLLSCANRVVLAAAGLSWSCRWRSRQWSLWSDQTSQFGMRPQCAQGQSAVMARCQGRPRTQGVRSQSIEMSSPNSARWGFGNGKHGGLPLRGNDVSRAISMLLRRPGCAVWIGNLGFQTSNHGRRKPRSMKMSEANALIPGPLPPRQAKGVGPRR